MGKTVAVRMNSAEAALVEVLLRDGGTVSDLLRLALLAYARQKAPTSFEAVGEEHGQLADWLALTDHGG
jgi:hypothetical protein